MSNLEVNKRSEVILLAFSGKEKNMFLKNANFGFTVILMPAVTNGENL